MKGTAGNPSVKGRAAARSALAIVVAGLCLSVLFGTSSLGAFAQVVAVETTHSESPTEEPSGDPQPSPTETGPSGPGISLLNPSIDYQPSLGVPAEPRPPIISDKFDGHDELFHVVAAVSELPQSPKVEAYWIPEGGAEVLVGTLDRVEASNTFEYFWDIPEELDGQHGVFEARLYRGTTQISKDSEEASIDSTEEAVEIVWPSNTGPLGFFKPRGGKWRTVMDGTVSDVGATPTGAGVMRVRGFYSVAKPGGDMEYKSCGAEVNPPAGPAGSKSRSFQMPCELGGKDTPSQVTAVAMVAADTDNAVVPGAGGFLTHESSDAHSVEGFAQKPEDMSVTITPVQPATTSAAYPTADAQQEGNDCLEFDVTVLDQMDRPVQGANVDVHLQGPSDEVGFGDEGSSSAGSSAYKAPDGANHEKELTWDCDASAGSETRWETEFGEHERPGSDDIKHAESIAGSGLSGPSSLRPGQWRFHVLSPDPGRTRITAWVDDKPLRKESDNRDLDNDKLQDTEPRDTHEAQWLAGPARVRLVPQSDTFVTGTCSPITVSVRGGRTPVEGANVDIHATGPTDDLDFCEPANGSDARAPDLGEHEEEDEQESTHPPASSTARSTQHTEGETDDSGSFTVGLQSPDEGNTTLQAWVDGTPGQDNDVRATSEPTGNGTYSWASSAADATVRFLNPSGYGDGSGDNVSTNPDANNYFHIVTRVDLPDLIDGVEILISSDGTSFSTLGDATRIGQSDVYEFKWTAANIDEGGYTLRAQIKGTERFDDREIDLDNSYQTTEISSPANNAVISFIEQKATVTGTASADAEGVTFYYTKTAARDANDEAQWVECGSVQLDTADAPQPFEGQCELAADDQPGSVTGIAAIADLCDPLVGCEGPLGSATHESGDAHRVFGLDAVPTVGISTGGGEAAVNTCQRVVVDVEDQAGGPVANANVDVHLDGPGNPHFCDVDNDSDRDAPDQGGHAAVSGHPDEGKHSDSEVIHTEGTSGSNGRFVVGITSSKEGVSRLTAWVDSTDDDDEGGGESSADARLEWVKGGRCTKSGTNGDDVLRGTPGNDRLCGLGGNDVIDGRGGRDVLIGGGGRDIIRGDSGNDRLRGGGGVDSLVGGSGDDKLSGGKANDVLSGRGGRDTLRGGSHNDSLKGGKGRDSCFGNSGSDRFRGCEQRTE